MKLASWNVNSVRTRLERLLAFFERHRPDVVCLQELKVETAGFPADAIRAAGYHAVVHGQKTYNGVAILSREEPQDKLIGFDDGEDDPQARLVAATIGGVRVLSAYAPNGSEVGSEKWAYKIAWYARLARYLRERLDPGQPVVLSGDLNVAPEERDVHDPATWAETVLFHPQARALLASIADWGLVDTFRLHDTSDGKFTWWDYRMGAFHRNWGVRIDFILATNVLARQCVSASIDRDERKGTQPSDHAPILSTFELASG
ncbi:MAG: exodeoxyribonuclease III [Candidatus Wallbacteria bacterium]|nr:exodeoxyribonuclease III [Candidatus Wallbacteria bacterium]